MLGSEEIREHVTGLDEGLRQRVADATERYVSVRDTPDRVLPLTHAYIEREANVEGVGPEAIHTLGSLMSRFPQVEVEVVKDLGGEGIALPLDIVTARHVETVNFLASVTPDLAQRGQEFRDVALSVVGRLAGTNSQQEAEELIFNATTKTGPRPADQIKEGADVVWGRIIPNVIVGMGLVEKAEKIDPTLRVLSGSPEVVV